MFNRFNKKAQIASTITWMVATLIIVFILGISLLLTVNVFADKPVESFSKKDTLVSKSFFSYLLTEDKRVYDEIKSSGNLTNFTGNLALQVFEGFFLEDYPKDVWVGVVYDFGLSDIKNYFFGNKLKTSIEGKTTKTDYAYSFENIKLNQNKTLEVVMLKYETK